MGRVCGKHQQFVQDGEECKYCEPTEGGFTVEYVATMRPAEPDRPIKLTIGAAPVVAVGTPNPGNEGSTPSRPATRQNFFDVNWIDKYDESYQEWRRRRAAEEKIARVTPAGRLNMVQELLSPKDEDGAPLPPLVSIDEAKKLLDLPESPLRPLYLDAEAQKFQQALLDHIEQLKKLVLQAFTMRIVVPAREPFDILREVCEEYSNKIIQGVRYHFVPYRPLNYDAWTVNVTALRGGHGGHCVARISALEVCANERAEDALRAAIISELERAARAARAELLKSFPAAAMEATPPSTREDAHGDQKGTRPR